MYIHSGWVEKRRNSALSTSKASKYHKKFLALSANHLDIYDKDPQESEDDCCPIERHVPLWTILEDIAISAATFTINTSERCLKFKTQSPSIWKDIIILTKSKSKQTSMSRAPSERFYDNPSLHKLNSSSDSRSSEQDNMKRTPSRTPSPTKAPPSPEVIHIHERKKEILDSTVKKPDLSSSNKIQQATATATAKQQRPRSQRASVVHRCVHAFGLHSPSSPLPPYPPPYPSPYMHLYALICTYIHLHTLTYTYKHLHTLTHTYIHLHTLIGLKNL